MFQLLFQLLPDISVVGSSTSYAIPAFLIPLIMLALSAGGKVVANQDAQKQKGKINEEMDRRRTEADARMSDLDAQMIMDEKQPAFESTQGKGMLTNLNQAMIEEAEKAQNRGAVGGATVESQIASKGMLQKNYGSALNTMQTSLAARGAANRGQNQNQMNYLMNSRNNAANLVNPGQNAQWAQGVGELANMGLMLYGSGAFGGGYTPGAVPPGGGY